MSERPPNAEGPAAEELGRLVDEIGARYAQGPYEAEIRAARAGFDDARGRVFDDDGLFAEHMALFLEWYVVERPLKREGETPLRVMLGSGELSEADRPLAEALARSHRSAFEVVGLRPAGLRLYDLIGDSFWWLPLGRGPGVGIVRGEIFEARLLPWQGAVALGPQVFYQPREAHDAIHRLIEARGKRGRLDEGLVFELAEMRLRHSRFRNIAVEHIYRDRVAGPDASSADAQAIVAKAADAGKDDEMAV